LHFLFGVFSRVEAALWLMIHRNYKARCLSASRQLPWRVMSIVCHSFLFFPSLVVARQTLKAQRR
jgi:hypothetical protein